MTTIPDGTPSLTVSGVEFVGETPSGLARSSLVFEKSVLRLKMLRGEERALGPEDRLHLTHDGYSSVGRDGWLLAISR